MLFAALVLAPLASSVSAQERYFDANVLANELATPYCSAALGPQSTPEETVLGDTCIKVAADYLIRRGMNFQSKGWLTMRECAERVILAHATDATPTDKILDAEFDKSCGGEPGLM